MNRPTLYFIITLVIIIIGLVVTLNIKNKQREAELFELRKAKIEADVLRQDAEGNYQKLVEDIYNQNQLNDELRITNSELADVVKRNGHTISGLTRIVGRFENRIDTIYLDTTRITENGMALDRYYPNREEWFIRYQADVDFATKRLIDRWEFSNLELNLVVAQNEDGLYEATLDGPDFLVISSLDVKTLQPVPDTDNFGWLVGGGVGRMFDEQVTFLQIDTGIRYKKFYFLISGGTNNSGAARVLYEF